MALGAECPRSSQRAARALCSSRAERFTALALPVEWNALTHGNQLSRNVGAVWGNNYKDLIIRRTATPSGYNLPWSHHPLITQKRKGRRVGVTGASMPGSLRPSTLEFRKTLPDTITSLSKDPRGDPHHSWTRPSIKGKQTDRQTAWWPLLASSQAPSWCREKWQVAPGQGKRKSCPPIMAPPWLGGGGPTLRDPWKWWPSTPSKHVKLCQLCWWPWFHLRWPLD